MVHPVIQEVFDKLTAEYITKLNNFDRNTNPVRAQIVDTVIDFVDKHPEFGYGALNAAMDYPIQELIKSSEEELAGMAITIPVRFELKVNTKSILSELVMNYVDSQEGGLT
jgi:hypothetical protein